MRGRSRKTKVEGGMGGGFEAGGGELVVGSTCRSRSERRSAAKKEE